MRRPLLALALLAAALVTAAQQGSTASNMLPPDGTAVYRGTTVTGATLLSLSHTVSGGSILAVTPKLRGVGLLAGAGGLLPRTVTARYATGASVQCTMTASNLLNLTTRLAEATYTCGPLLERADRPRALTITVS